MATGASHGSSIAVGKGHALVSISMSDEAADLIANLARETGRGEGDVLRLALAMFKVAVDARREGKHVGVAGTPEALDVEFVGF